MKKLIILLIFLLSTIGLFSQTEMINNGTFDNENYWSAGTGWTIGSGVASYDNIGIGILGQSSGNMISSIIGSTLYTLQFDLVVPTGSAYFAIMSADVKIYVSATSYSSGHKTIQFTTPSNVGTAGLHFYTYNDVDFTIDNISLIIGIPPSGSGPYYVATNGNDSNIGDINHPWLTWQKGFETAEAGDTVYFRGGIYYPTTFTHHSSVIYLDQGVTEIIGHTGTEGSPICFFAYPPDYAAGNYPILDCSLINTGVPGKDEQRYSQAMSFLRIDYLQINGLQVRNLYQRYSNVFAQAIYCYGNSNMLIENMVIHDIGGRAFVSFQSLDYTQTYHPEISFDTTRFINNDAYNLCDSLDPDPSYQYEDPRTSYVAGLADGFKVQAEGGVMMFDGCRLWHYSDDGIDFNGNGKLIVENCWIFRGGDFVFTNEDGSYGGEEGNGIKFGALGQNIDAVTRVINHCLVAYSGSIGFDENNSRETYQNINSEIYNNTSYKNEVGFGNFSQNPNDLPYMNKFFNNISYMDEAYPRGDEAGDIIEGYNSWDALSFEWNINGIPPHERIPIRDNDFVSLDSTQLYLPRKVDGSLPDITFLKLAPTSDAIDAGTDLGFPYTGAAPDIGYAEYTSEINDSIGYINHNGYIITHNNYIISIGLPTTGSDEEPLPEQIIADHTVVDKYDDIPQQWIDSVKKMWVVVAGESHSSGYRNGLNNLESQNAIYAVLTRESGIPDIYTTSNLRFSRATWGDYSNSSGWIYDYGEEDWWTNATAINRTKAGLLYCKNTGPRLTALGFGWCWDTYAGTASTGTDPVTGNHWYGWSIGSASGDKAWGIDDADNAISGNVVNMDDYLAATQAYIDYCVANGISTKVFFTTGPVDYDLGTVAEANYQAHLKYEHIRNYVNADVTRILFDYADILCYNDSNVLNTSTWNGNPFPTIATANASPVVSGDHISAAGELRIAKAMWWMLARIAGWDGN